MPKFLKIPPQILMLLMLTVAIVGSYRVARHFLTPASFGQEGWFRAAAPGEIASRDPLYAGKQACEECHTEKVEELGKFEHKTLSCESCHKASKAHAENPDILPQKLDPTFCLRCHEASPSRPEWMSQIVSSEHYKSPGSTDTCLSCHLPHHPGEMPDDKPAK